MDGLMWMSRGGSLRERLVDISFVGKSGHFQVRIFLPMFQRGAYLGVNPVLEGSVVGVGKDQHSQTEQKRKCSAHMSAALILQFTPPLRTGPSGHFYPLRIIHNTKL